MYLEQWLILKNLENSIYQELELALGANKDHPIKLNEFYVLHFLNVEDVKASRLQELGEKVGLSPSAMSRMIMKMESQSCGVITRKQCAEDKRGVHITLTPKGEEILSDAQAIVETVLAKYTKDLERLK